MLAEIAATNAKLDELCLLLDSDPRRVTKIGGAQTGAAADPRFARKLLTQRRSRPTVKPKRYRLDSLERKMRPFSICAALCLVANGSDAQQICDSVLNRDLVNVRSIEVSESIIARMQADVCSRDHSSASAAQEYMRTGGWSLDVFGYFDNALTDTKNRSSDSYRVQESEFCDRSAGFHSSNLATSISDANAGLVLDAYTECIRLTQESGLWMTYEIVEDGKALRGTLRRRATPNTPLGYSIEDLSISSTDSATVKCNLLVDGDYVEGQALEAREIDAGTATFTCIKSGNGAAFVDLRTSIVEFPLYMPSADAVERNDIGEVRDQVQRLQQEFEEDRAGRRVFFDEISGSDLDHTFRADLESDAILFVAAFAGGRYDSGGRVNAGELVNIWVNRQHCAGDRSFEGESSNIVFSASASCIRLLDAGSHNIRVRSQPTRTGSNVLRAAVTAIPAR